MKSKGSWLVVTALAVTGGRVQASQIDVDLSEWNVITSGDLQNVSEFNGNAYVGGNVTASGSFSVGNNNTDVKTPGNVSLAVAGNINSGNNINVDSGNVVAGGTISSGRNFNLNSGGTITKGNPSALPASPVAQVKSASQYWSTLPSTANGSVAVANNAITFNAPANTSVAVFNVTAGQLFAANQSIALNPSSATQILINVSGTSATELNSESFTGSFSSYAGNVVFNFYQATSVAFNGGSPYGYIVAPDATVTANTPIVGGVMASVLNTSSEVDLPNSSDPADYITAPDVSSVPDGGSTAALLGISFGGLAVFRRKYFRR